MNELEPLETKLTALLANLSPAARKKMATDIARKLRASQQHNIKQQQAPDGTPFKLRKAQTLRDKKGRVKRQMFAKLLTSNYLKTKASNEGALVEFTGRVQHMARVHHYGLFDRPARCSKDVKYESRPLLGFNAKNHTEIINLFYKSLGKG
ncbi:phage virion morphogenesis protein [Erwinia aphidicola]|uniref:phage virion morphogenesis protein n=1 Tax=Erwinia aphidicola TaxID=68334 RepID=UPI00209C9F1C|nr:phage virion morphogenesis protein [Erwinia aphidicola]MCP2231846.1 phage virion morphogenesis protein [Erwinia aphidicola]